MTHEFYQHIKSHAEKNPEHPAIIDGETTVTYGQLLEKIKQFAGGLDNLKLNPESKLGLLCANQKEYLVACLGAFLKGLTVVPFNFMLKPEDLVFITKDAEIDSIVVDSMFIKQETKQFTQHSY